MAVRRRPVPPPDLALIREVAARALEEDRAAFDVTTHALVPPDQRGRARFVFRQPGVVCGIPVAHEVFALLSAEVELRPLREEGAWVEGGTAAAEVDGPLSAILSGERVALNLVQRLSGVATMTRTLVEEAAKGGAARIIDTRKTTPGLRALERYAVRAGGGANHRDNLQDGVLIKDNHIAAAARRGLTLSEVIREARARAPHTLRVEVEADTAEQAHEAIEAGADVVLLDNMSPAQMRAIIDAAPREVVFEASGGITLETVREIAGSGVDLISVGALTHSAPALDVGLDIEAR